MEPDYIPTCKSPSTLLPQQRDVPRLLFFSWALLPAGRTNNHFSRSDTALYNISLQPSPKHQSHAIYHKLENSLNLAYFESNGGSSSPHEDSPASCPPSWTIGRERGHPSLVPRLCARKETGGWWGVTMERQLHGTSHGVQACVKGCKQPEPINFHIPFQSDVETKRVAFSTGHSVQGESKKKGG